MAQITDPNDTDLISFHSDDAVATSPTHATSSDDGDPDANSHLLDTELSQLEETLLKNRTNTDDITNDSKDEFLISLSDASNVSNRTVLTRSNSALLLDLSDHCHPEINRSKSDNYLERYFESESRKESNKSTSEEVDRCLLDLDTYLEAFESSFYENETNDGVRKIYRPSVALSSSPQNDFESNVSDNYFQANLSLVTKRMSNDKLAQQFNETGGNTNFAYIIDTEEMLTRSNTLPSKRKGLQIGSENSAFKRYDRYRNTIGFFPSKKSDSNDEIVTKDFLDVESDEYDEDIDWSWVDELDRNQQSVAMNPVMLHQHDPPPTTSTSPVQLVSNSSPLVQTDVSTTNNSETTTTMSEEEQTKTEPPRSSWLRTSMRRIRHFRLPSDTISTPIEPLTTIGTPQTLVAVQASNPMDNLSPQHRSSRPTSAPQRLSFTEQRNNPRVSVHPRGAPHDHNSGANENHVHRSRSSSTYCANRQSRSANRNQVNTRSTARSSSDSSRSQQNQRHHRPRSVSSTDSSLGGVSSVETTPSCSPTATPSRATPEVIPPRACDRTVGTARENAATTTTTRRVAQENSGTNNHNNHHHRHHHNRGTNTGRPPGNGVENPLGQWKHRLSPVLAYLGCTLGIFNISRFAILSLHFGANFIIQFLVLSLVFGIPLFTLHTCLGQQLGSGVMNMWKVSPIFQGVGVALLLSQALIGIYSIIGVSWMFVYFRDSFITKMDDYKWAEPFNFYRDDIRFDNDSFKLTETVPDYFNGQVLQRLNLAYPGASGHRGVNDEYSSHGTIKFQVCFNLAVVWVIIFASLSKGLKSYGKIVFLFSLLPLLSMLVLCAKMLGLTPNGTESRNTVFSETSWPEFFLNTKCWVAAFQESFLTWGLFGAAAMQIASHNKHKNMLRRETGLIVIVTCTVLLLAAFLANTCVEIIKFYGYLYLPGSFETSRSYIFMRSSREPLPPSLAATPVRYMMHSSLILGERVIRPGIDRAFESGYQPLRFATELIPATFSIIGSDQLSPFWAVLFYFVMILFGIGQQLAIWHCVITGIMEIKVKVLEAWETSIIFFSCLIGFLLGLSMTTEFGIYTVYFMDYCVGGAWWIAILYMLMVCAVFMVRGRPYSGDSVVMAMFTPDSHACLTQWAGPLLSFTWNVVLPIALVVYCISSFKNGNFRELYTWHHAGSYDYWPLWARQLGTFLQLMPILTVPIVAFIQSYRYLNNGPPDILDRIQLLYRPPMDNEQLEDLRGSNGTPHNNNNLNNGTNNNTTNSSTTTDPTFEDPPPKYTPPPSYTTATGARIAKLLRQSIRRSVRRIANVLGESSDVSRGNNRESNQQIRTAPIQPPPPDYAAVLVEMNHPHQTDVTSSDHIAISVSETIDYPNVRNAYNSESNRNANTLSNNHRIRPTTSPSSTLTAADVAHILRSSLRRSTIRAANTLRRSVRGVPSSSRTSSNQNSLDNSNDIETGGSLSVVCLVDGAEPIGQDSLDMTQIQEQNQRHDDHIIKSDDLSSVI